MKQHIKIILILGLVIQISVQFHQRYETRYCTQDQKGGSNSAFAQRLKDYVYTCPQPSGYCVFENPTYPITNQSKCGAGSNIGWIITYSFTEAYPTNLQIDWGTDFGGGSAIFVNGVLDVAYQQDFWWAMNWNSPGVFNLNYDFPAGYNEILIVANEFCCDGPMEVQFSRNGGPKKPLTEDNLECQQTNSCDGVSCNTNEYKDGFQCIACDYQCATCDGAPDQCLTCNDSGNRLQAPGCQCKTGYYDQNGNQNCQQCHNSCQTCSGSSSCDTCPDHHYQNGYCYSCATTHNYNNCGTCNAQECLTCKDFPQNYLPLCTGTSCQSNQYLVGKICKDCPPTCKTCVDSTGCSSCENNEYMESGVCKSCITQYGANCGTCTQFQCSTCLNDITYKLPGCTKTTCDPGEMVDGNHCRLCVNGCEQCSDQVQCDVCFDGQYKTNSNQCLPCQQPCLTCTTSATNCLSCQQQNFDVNSGCTTCMYRFYMTQGGQCASCSDHYGNQCGVCDQTECSRCHNNNQYTLPDCTSTTCPLRQYQDSYICKDCVSDCLVCQNGTTCENCNDLFFKHSDGTCQQCQYPCLLCSNPTTCTLCAERGWKPPACDSCGQGFFMKNNQCIQQCGEGYYGRYSDNTCQQCDSTCFDCENDAYYCTICPNNKFLYNGKCVDCGDVIGMEQDPDEPIGVCREVCGDGKRLVPASVHECDDGNFVNGDGCSSNCTIEEGWTCSGGSIAYPDKCLDKRPIGFKVLFKFAEKYLNVEENAPIQCTMVFNKTFTLPQGTSLKDYIVLSVDGKDTSGFKLKVSENKGKKKKRYLQQNNSTNSTENVTTIEEEEPEFDMQIQVDTTLRNRNLVVDLFPKSAFQDGSGNTLADEPPPKGEVKDYFYYNEEERNNTRLFEFWMEISVLALMCFLPIYVFYYKNHFNRFYVIFMIIDSTQTLYFYRFLNIRWAINGIKFYRKLRPVIGFYMSNFYYRNITEEEYPTYSSGVQKFDDERESALFINNTGSILTLFFIYIFCYLVVVIFSQKKLYGSTEAKMFQFFYQARFGYFQWGVWFDSMMASCGVFIVYILLQLMNPKCDYLNFFMAAFVGVFYFGFFIAVARYMSKNLKNLYTVDKDEPVDGLKLEEKLGNNKTFKLRNVWHFVHNLHHLPQKGYFYYIFIMRKLYLSSCLLIFQNHVTIQLLMCSFSHLIVIILMLKYKFFYETRETIKCIMSETLIFLAIGCMYFLLDDVSEEESYRLTFSWIVLALLLLSLFIHGVYFIYNEILGPFVRFVLNKKKGKDIKRVVDLRSMRKEGQTQLNIGETAKLNDNSSSEDTSSVNLKKNNGQEVTQENLGILSPYNNTTTNTTIMGAPSPAPDKKKRKLNNKTYSNGGVSVEKQAGKFNFEDSNLPTNNNTLQVINGNNNGEAIIENQNNDPTSTEGLGSQRGLHNNNSNNQHGHDDNNEQHHGQQQKSRFKHATVRKTKREPSKQQEQDQDQFF